MIGLSTYAMLWAWSDRATDPLTLGDMLRRTRDLGVDGFQICDYPPLTAMSGAELRDLRATADDLGIRLELGTRGIGLAHLSTFLRLADVLGARLVRSMLYSADSRPGPVEAERMLRAALPSYRDAGVTLALETYEQVSSADLVALVETLADDALGICLDPANCVAALEHPREVVERCAPWVRNLHVKDFAFSRRDGWVGFTLAGAECGTGRLDLDHLLRTVDPVGRGISRIVEHWVPWQGDLDSTLALEDHWTTSTVAYLKEHE